MLSNSYSFSPGSIVLRVHMKSMSGRPWKVHFKFFELVLHHLSLLSYTLSNLLLNRDGTLDPLLSVSLLQYTYISSFSSSSNSYAFPLSNWSVTGCISYTTASTLKHVLEGDASSGPWPNSLYKEPSPAQLRSTHEWHFYWLSVNP